MGSTQSSNGDLEWPLGNKITDADIGVIVAYFVVILAVGIWVSSHYLAKFLSFNLKQN